MTDGDRWALAYGSEERVEWVKAQGCRVEGCTTRRPRPGLAHPIENAHTRAGGMGMKAAARFVLNLCWIHHDELDAGKRSFARKYGFDPVEEALALNARWLRYREGLAW